MSRPLAGLQVVECASFVAGPTGGMTLAQLGASVIRIDPIGGNSDYRRWPVVGHGSGPADAEYHVVAGDGSWSVSMKERGTITALRGLSMDELQGLPDAD